MSPIAKAEPTTLASWCATLVRALDAQGLDGRALAQRAGVDLAALDEADGRVPRLALTQLWRLAVEATADPCFGLTTARFTAQTSFHALGYASLASATLAEAFHRAVRFRRMVGDVLELSLVQHGDVYRFTIDVSAPPGAPFEAVDAIAALSVRIARLLRGDRDFNPLRVLLQRPEPRGSETYARVFRAPVLFEQEINALEYPRAEFDARLPTANAELARQNDQVATRYIERLARPSLSARVQQALLDALPNGAPSKPALARQLGMSPRSLQRHLADEGTSFEELLTELRGTLARNYLTERRLNVTEVAFLLGFADTSTFSRAFKRWTGKAPSEFATSA